MNKTCVRDLRAIEQQDFQPGNRFQVHQSPIRDRRSRQLQIGQLGHVPQMFQAGVGDLGAGEYQAIQTAKTAQVDKVSVGQGLVFGMNIVDVRREHVREGSDRAFGRRRQELAVAVQAAIELHARPALLQRDGCRALLPA